eukprot:Protomagalhaensia_wolfi_Nauph_80__1551@NODE_1951_length_1267_cov_184_995114_g1527_i0_p2_GENE_NODE_1951_length_1267_cov_184_995114_g1527_i0NODE_1951_length_1267_cov_184_995114_g1527_i0_p2_ORF_typecomplete_len111_score14_36_NODE_1951_length_1267_cov_184_995114_g1527_i0285617
MVTLQQAVAMNSTLPLVEIDLSKDSVPVEIPEGPTMYLIHDNHKNYRIASTRDGRNFLTRYATFKNVKSIKVQQEDPTVGTQCVLKNFYRIMDTLPVAMDRDSFLKTFFL